MLKITLAKANPIVCLVTTILLFLNLNATAQAPNISYPKTSYVVNTNSAISPITPANTGGSITYGKVSTVSGNGLQGADDGVAMAPKFNRPQGVVVDASGNVYVADNYNHKIRKISTSGVVTTFAGSGLQGATDGLGTAASFNYPANLAIDGNGNIYVTDWGNRKIRMISPGGLVSTFAGSGAVGSADGVGIAASFVSPFGIVCDASGNLYVTDRQDNKIRKITSSGVVSTYAGTGVAGSTDGASSTATFSWPNGIAINSSGVLFITDANNNKIRRISATGNVTTYAGTGVIGSTNGSLNVATFSAPNGIVIDATGNIYVADQSNCKIRKITSAGVVSDFAGSGANTSLDGTGTAASFFHPSGLALTTGGTIYVAEESAHIIRKITSAAVVTTFAGSKIAGSDDGTGIPATFYQPCGLAVDASNNLYIADRGNDKIRKLNTASVSSSYSAVANSFPHGVAVDASGNIFFTDYSNRIRKINTSGIVSVFAGSGTAGTVNGTGTAASFNDPRDIVIDASGNLYVADKGNNKIRKITSTGIVTTFAGSGNPAELDGTGVAASFNSPIALTIDATGNIYVADSQGETIRKVTTSAVVTTIINSTAALTRPSDVGIDNIGNLYIVDQFKNRIYRYDVNNELTEMAGSTIGDVDDFGTLAKFNSPYGCVVNNTTNELFIGDADNNKIKKISFLGYSISPKLPTGLTIDPNSGVISGIPTQLTPVTSYTVTATNSSGTSQYTFSLSTINTNANLSAIQQSAGTLSPSFSPSTTSYNTSVNYNTSTYTVNPVTEDPKISSLHIQFNNGGYVKIVAGVPVYNLNLGINTLDIKVTAQDGVTTKIYSLNIKRLSNDALLSNLSISAGTLTPTFISSIITYTDTVANAISSITITPTTNSNLANVRVQINGGSSTLVTSGTPSNALALNIGNNTLNVLVTAEDGTTKTYTITIRRISNNANLNNIVFSPSTTISPTFISTTNAYTATVANATTLIKVRGTISYAAATMQYQINNGTYTNLASNVLTPDLPLTVGFNTINLKVTAEDGVTINTYTIIVKRLSNDANLSNLVLSTGVLSPVFNSNTQTYNTTVSSSTSSITLTANYSYSLSTAQIQINGGTFISITNNTTSSNLSLNNGDNVIIVKVTSEDGLVTKSYGVTVKKISNNANLSSLSLAVGSYTPGFNVNTTSYSSNHINTVLTNQVRATVADAFATLTYQVNGSTYASLVSGNYSNNFNLNVGNNIINVLVTAEDGTTTKTYTITAVRQPSNIANLSALTVSTGGLTPIFNASTLNYSTTNVANTVLSTTVTAALQEPNATIEVRINSGAYITLANNTASSPLLLNVGSNTIDIKVTAQNGTTIKTYTISIIRNPPPPTISYSIGSVLQTYIVPNAITPITPINTGGTVASYSISPILPAGLSFNTLTGVISGAPTVASPETIYTIMATNVSGNSSTTVNISTEYPLPVITSFSQNSVCLGDTLTVIGTNFYGITQVRIGDVPQAVFTVQSPTSIKVTVGKAKTGVVSLINETHTGTSSSNLIAGFVPDFNIYPSNFKLCGNNPRDVYTSMYFPNVTYTCSNGQSGSLVKVSAPGTYTLTATDATGCSKSKSFTVSTYNSCDGYLELLSDSAIDYFNDTIDVKIKIKNAVDIFSVFAYLKFDATYLTFLDSKVGSFLGGSVISQPPVLVGDKINFGMSRQNGQPGVNGDGIVYEFRFVIKQLPAGVTYDKWFPNDYPLAFSLSNLSVFNTSGSGITPISYNTISLLSDTCHARYYVPVWPGDLNNDKKVNVADLLPIGYFYGSTGPIRPEGSLLWKAQPALLWGYDISSKNASAYKTFADATPDGIVDLADQSPIGYNLSKIHARSINNLQNADIKPKAFPTNMPAINATMPDTVIQFASLPQIEQLTIAVGSSAYPINNLYGLAFEISFNPACVDIAGITTNYTGTIFGTYGTTYTRIEDFSDIANGKLGIGLTRFNTTAITANGGQVLTISFPLITTAPSGWFKVTALPIGCNDKFGNDLTITGSEDSLRINGATANLSIAGRIKTPLLKPVKTVACSLKGVTTMLSDVAGAYQFTSGIAANNSVTIKPSKNNDITKANGINTTDVLFIQRHILNTSKLNSAYKLIAADVDGNKAVNSVDVLRIKRLVLGTDTTFTSTLRGSRLWEFVDSAYVFPDTTNPFPFKDSISFTNLTSNKINQTFIGVKLGDVNYDWNPAVAKQSTTNNMHLIANIQAGVVNGELRIPVTVTNFKELVAMQYTLHFDNKNYEFVGIENNKIGIDFNEKQATGNGNISMLWTDKNAEPKTLEDGTELFTLVLRSTVNSPQLTDLALTNDITEIKAWDKDLNQHNIILTKQQKFQTSNIEQWFVSPNPTSGEVKVSIISKVNKTVSFELTDAQGKLIFKRAVELQKGNNSFTLNLKQNNNITTGIYFLKAVGVEGQNVKRIMVK